ncbi:hypothetical protein D3C76_1427960 [compost metagenome]
MGAERLRVHFCFRLVHPLGAGHYFSDYYRYLRQFDIYSHHGLHPVQAGDRAAVGHDARPLYPTVLGRDDSYLSYCQRDRAYRFTLVPHSPYGDQPV